MSDPENTKISNKYDPIEIEKWTSPVDQRATYDDKMYVVKNLHAQADNLVQKELPLEHLNICGMKVGEMDVKEFVKHMDAVLNCDLNYPIILDDTGSVMDGRHRIAKALFERNTHIKFVRFKKTPDHDYVEEEEE